MLIELSTLLIFMAFLLIVDSLQSEEMICDKCLDKTYLAAHALRYAFGLILLSFFLNGLIGWFVIFMWVFINVFAHALIDYASSIIMNTRATEEDTPGFFRTYSIQLLLRLLILITTYQLSMR